MIFETLATSGHEQVVFCHNKDAGLKAIIAIHNTVLGPALGGLRMWPYKTEQEALNDVLRLSRGMTYKAAVAGLNLGGGKAVIIGDPSKDKSEALFRAFGRFVNSLGGRYITAEDVGIDVNDMEYVLKETEYVTGVHQVHGGSGDPSPFTAYGTLQGIMASAQRALRQRGRRQVFSFAVQGVGHVGLELVKLLRANAAPRSSSPTSTRPWCSAASTTTAARPSALDEIYDVDADVYSPCALGGTVNEKTLPRFKFKIICGAANNQLATDAIGDEARAPRHPLRAGLRGERGRPDERVAWRLDGYNRERAMRMMRTIYYNLGKHLRDRQARRHPDLQGRRPHGRRAHQHHRQAIKLPQLVPLPARTARFWRAPFLREGDAMTLEGRCCGSLLDAVVVFDAGTLLTTDLHGIARQLARTGQGVYVVDEKRSAALPATAKSFPANAELEALLTFKGAGEGNFVRDIAMDTQSLSLRQHLSLVRLPHAGYSSRDYHPASGGLSVAWLDFFPAPGREPGAPGAAALPPRPDRRRRPCTPANRVLPGSRYAGTGALGPARWCQLVEERLREGRIQGRLPRGAVARGRGSDGRALQPDHLGASRHARLVLRPAHHRSTHRRDHPRQRDTRLAAGAAGHPHRRKPARPVRQGQRGATQARGRADGAGAPCASWPRMKSGMRSASHTIFPRAATAMAR
jgi:leucine dehydrogenase